MSMKWTRVPPEMPGWWWLANEAQVGKASPRPTEVYRDRHGDLAVSGHSLAWWRDMGMRLIWCGPIAEPPDVMGADLEED